jgi:uncharacterized membrane protein YgcG
MKIKISASQLQTLVLAILVCSVLFCATALAQTTDAQSSDPTNTKPNSSSITGRVLTQTNQPVLNATVFASRLNSPSPPRPVPVDADGNFKFAGLEPGVYAITASAPSFIMPPREPNSVASEYHHIGDNVTIMMVKGGVINGHVTDPDDKPIVAVRVRAMMVRDANGQASNSITTERLTDDRGVYRLYGLLPGTYVVSAGGASAFSGGGTGGGFGGGGGRGGFGGGFGGGGFGNPATAVYDRDAPTFSLSSTRDTAVEVTVNAGDEINDVNIRYRSEPGHAISGTVKSSGALQNGYARSTVALSRPNREGEIVSYAIVRGATFVFYGVANGEYELTAQTSLGPEDEAVSQPRRIVVNGSNVTGVVLTTSPLASVTGRVTLEPSAAAECKDKPLAQFAEILISAQREAKKTASDSPLAPQFSSAKAAPGRNGDFLLSKLAPGQYKLDTRFFAKYWYLRAMTLHPAAAPKTASRTQPANQNVTNPTFDLTRKTIPLSLGTRVAGVNVVLTEGAASLRGHLTAGENEKLPPGMIVYLIPAEKDQAENWLRYFTSPVNADGTFTINNLPPGTYWALPRQNNSSEAQVVSRLRLTEGAEDRAKLRRDGEALKANIELKPCEDMGDYQVPMTSTQP